MIVKGKSGNVAALDLSDGKTVCNTTKQILIGPDQGASNFVMRLFVLKEGGHSPSHSHPWEHEVFVLTGKGRVKSQGDEIPVEKGDFVYVPPMEKHQFLNTGSTPFEFLCIVPAENKR